MARIRMLSPMLFLLLPACGGTAVETETVEVTRIIDGDTVELADGQQVRYLMIDTPEITGGKNDCYGQEAKLFNQELVLNQQVELRFDVEREDFYGRLLAYVRLGEREINTLLVERGFACVLCIPPNGTDREAEFENLEAAARAAGRGMWGACEEVACAN